MNTFCQTIDSKRFYSGGNFGIQFGTVTMIDISPIIGYKLTDRLSVGGGLSYEYMNDHRYMPDLSIHVIGGRMFSRFLITENLFAHVEYEHLTYKTASINDGYRVNIDNYLIGGGYKQEIGNNVFINLTILYNLNQTPYNLYSNPVIRGGIQVGL